jgi:hypothetical protein
VVQFRVEAVKLNLEQINTGSTIIGLLVAETCFIYRGKKKQHSSTNWSPQINKNNKNKVEVKVEVVFN